MHLISFHFIAYYLREWIGIFSKMEDGGGGWCEKKVPDKIITIMAFWLSASMNAFFFHSLSLSHYHTHSLSKCFSLLLVYNNFCRLLNLRCMLLPWILYVFRWNVTNQNSWLKKFRLAQKSSEISEFNQFTHIHTTLHAGDVLICLHIHTHQISLFQMLPQRKQSHQISACGAFQVIKNQQFWNV